MHTPSRSTSKEALTLLVGDHQKVKAMIGGFPHSKSVRKKNAENVCDEFTLHSLIEEKIFYPKTRKFASSRDLINKAILDHAGAKELISKLAGPEPYGNSSEMKSKKMVSQVYSFDKRKMLNSYLDMYKPDVFSSVLTVSKEGSECDLDMIF